VADRECQIRSRVEQAHALATEHAAEPLDGTELPEMEPHQAGQDQGQLEAAAAAGSCTSGYGKDLSDAPPLQRKSPGNLRLGAQ
jgi:hypothetical protein